MRNGLDCIPGEAAKSHPRQLEYVVGQTSYISMQKAKERVRDEAMQTPLRSKLRSKLEALSQMLCLQTQRSFRESSNLSKWWRFIQGSAKPNLQPTKSNVAPPEPQDNILAFSREAGRFPIALRTFGIRKRARGGCLTFPGLYE